jgi:hypothetical protein
VKEVIEMKRTPILIVMAGGIVLLNRLIPVHVVPAASAAIIHVAPRGTSALPADDAGSDDSDDEDSDDSK